MDTTVVDVEVEVDVEVVFGGRPCEEPGLSVVKYSKPTRKEYLPVIKLARLGVHSGAEYLQKSRGRKRCVDT
jgi:hypothetical protein